MKKTICLTWMFFFILGCSGKVRHSSSSITGDYLGEPIPKDRANLFAPAVVSTPMNEDGGPVFTPDGNEIFWRIGGAPFSTFVTMKRIKDHWTAPRIASFSGRYQDAGLAISPDGKRIFFSSKRPFRGVTGLDRFHTWITERIDGKWQTPVPAGEPIDHPVDYYTVVSISADGTLVKHSKAPGGSGGFDLYLCRYVNGTCSEPVNLRDINTPANEYAPAIAPDGSYILFQSDNRPDTLGGLDIYVSFSKKDGSWTAPVNLGDTVNTRYTEKWPTITPDGAFLFFTSDRPVEIKYAQYSEKRKTLQEIKALYQFYHSPRQGLHAGDVYWIDTRIIRALKPTTTGSSEEYKE